MSILKYHYDFCTGRVNLSRALGGMLLTPALREDGLSKGFTEASSRTPFDPSCISLRVLAINCRGRDHKSPSVLVTASIGHTQDYAE
jgi:hypothetical protein